MIIKVLQKYNFLNSTKHKSTSNFDIQIFEKKMKYLSTIFLSTYNICHIENVQHPWRSYLQRLLRLKKLYYCVDKFLLLSLIFLNFSNNYFTDQSKSNGNR